MIPFQTAYSAIHYPNVSKNQEAQLLFDKGMLYYYAYSYSQAEEDFRQALKEDADCGMCYFGLAIAKKQQALELGVPFATLGLNDIKQASAKVDPREGFYFDVIQAAEQSFSSKQDVKSSQLQHQYIQALQSVYDKYKDNNQWGLESLALYVDAIGYYSNVSDAINHCGRVLNDELKAKAISLMTRILSNASYPDHPGLIHTYIHMTERNLDDPLGLLVAQKLPTFSHGMIAHYTHMPNHIYWRRGMYDKAIKANLDAIAIDENYFNHQGVGRNTYYYEYHFLHSHHFLVALGILTNDYPLALENAQAIKKLMNVQRLEQLKEYRDVLFSLEHLVNARFKRWSDVLQLKVPDQRGELGELFMQFTRALAYLNLGHDKPFQQIFDPIKNTHYTPMNLQDIQTLVLTYLEASQMDLQKKSMAEMEQLFLKNQVDKIENKLFVMNPPLWFFPYQLFLSDKAFARGDLKAAKLHHDLFEKMYPRSTLGEFH